MENSKVDKVWEAIQKKGFWVVILLLAGFLIGSLTQIKILELKTAESVELGGLIHKGVVYEIKAKP